MNGDEQYRDTVGQGVALGVVGELVSCPSGYITHTTTGSRQAAPPTNPSAPCPTRCLPFSVHSTDGGAGIVDRTG